MKATKCGSENLITRVLRKERFKTVVHINYQHNFILWGNFFQTFCVTWWIVMKKKLLVGRYGLKLLRIARRYAKTSKFGFLDTSDFSSFISRIAVSWAWILQNELLNQKMNYDVFFMQLKLLFDAINGFIRRLHSLK